MCPVVLLAMLFSLLMFLLEITAAINVTFIPKIVKKLQGEQETVYFSMNVSDYSSGNESLYKVISEDSSIAGTSNLTFLSDPDQQTLNGSFLVKGNFLGVTRVRIVKEKNGKEIESSDPLDVRILRNVPLVAKIFKISVIVLVALNYVNMGCALDLNVVKSVLRKPIAPTVGFVCQYTIMPLVAYGLARLLFDDMVLQLSLFTFGCSPGGGASNTWVVFLKGNLNLSLTMTFISGLAALGMMPLWLFTLGKTLFSTITPKIPFMKILGMLSLMAIMLSFGLLFQKYLPKVAKVGRRILAPASVIMILFIIVFGTYANLYMFQLFTWQIILAATINVWLGFVFGAIASAALHLSFEDIIAISIETGVQNTGVAIGLLGFSLPQPESDLAIVVPVAASIMTPIPLLAVYCFYKIRLRFSKKKHLEKSYMTNEDEERKALPMPNSSDSISTQRANGYVY